MSVPTSSENDQPKLQDADMKTEQEPAKLTAAQQPVEGEQAVPKKESELQQEHLLKEPKDAARSCDYKLHHTLNGHTLGISALKFSPDGKILASSGKQDVQYTWHLTYTV